MLSLSDASWAPLFLEYIAMYAIVVLCASIVDFLTQRFPFA